MRKLRRARPERTAQRDIAQNSHDEHNAPGSVAHYVLELEVVYTAALPNPNSA